MLKVVGNGFILVETRVKGLLQNIRMHDVLHMPNLYSNLLSVRGLKVHFNSLGFVVKTNNDEMLVVASLESNLYLYQLDTNVINGAKTSFLACSTKNMHSLKLWHKRLGHLNANSLKYFKAW